MMESNRAIERHYTREGLRDVVLKALDAAGKDHESLSHGDTATLDEFHIRGREATQELAELAGLRPGQRVLDVGCGIGGSSRFLASEVGCHVTGVDLTEAYCDVATMLAEKMGLSDRVEYRHGDALDLPFAESSFDAVWTQHASMNIQDKNKLYSEMSRVLEIGGTLALYDVVQGDGGEAHFPVPWAPDASISFLMRPDAMRSTLESVGFRIEAWRDTTQPAREWFQGFVKSLKEDGPRPLGLHVIIGPEAKTRFENMGRCLEEGRVGVVQALATRAK